METIKTFLGEKQSPTWESVKEFLRVLLFGVASFVVTEAVVFLEGSEQSVWIVLILAGFRWLDKYLHTTGKLEKGLTRF